MITSSPDTPASEPATTFAVDEVALAPWQRHNGRLGASSLISIACAAALWFASPTPDGRNPLYVAIAIEFVVWGAINLFFTIGGYRGGAAIRSIDAPLRTDAALKKMGQIVRALRLNTWLNLVWLTTGIGLLVWGYCVWSASLVGHGAGVLSQAIVLTLLDGVFVRELRAASIRIDEIDERAAGVTST